MSDCMLPPQARVAMFISALITWIIGSLISGVGAYLNFLFMPWSALEKLVYLIFILLFISCSINLITSPLIGYRRYRYLLEEDRLEVRKGIFYITRSILPLNRLHQVSISAGPLLRLFRLAEVTATSAGGELTISYLPAETAEEIALHLKDRINIIAKEEERENELP